VAGRKWLFSTAMARKSQDWHRGKTMTGRKLGDWSLFRIWLLLMIALVPCGCAPGPGQEPGLDVLIEELEPRVSKQVRQVAGMQDMMTDAMAEQLFVQADQLIALAGINALDDADGLYLDLVALRYYRDRYGWPDEKTLAAARRGAEHLLARGRYDQAAWLASRVVSLRTEEEQPDRRQLVRDLQLLALLREQQGQKKEAVGLYREILDLDRELNGAVSEETVSDLETLARLSEESGDLAAARRYTLELLETLTALRGPSARGRESVLRDLAEICHALGRNNEAAKYEQLLENR